MRNLTRLVAIALLIADNVPIFDAAISPLVPVLRDNMWLTIHVLTIMLGYAAFTLAMGIGHLNRAGHDLVAREIRRLMR